MVTSSQIGKKQCKFGNLAWWDKF